MRKIFYLLLLSAVLCSELLAQSNSSIKESYESYFELPRESVFLHLNKSTYVVGEELWFSAYAYDRKSALPFTQTTNLHVVLYNEQGKPLEDRLVMTVNGFARGNIPIDSTYNSGDYYIKAYTNWMRNFSEDDSFVQKVEIINSSAELQKVAATNYDLQLLPEGGHLVQGVESVVGVKLINSDGRGVIFERGSLINKNGRRVMDFEGNAFGMASFPIRPTSGDYKVRINFGDNRVVTTPLPQVSETGIILRVVNNYGDPDILLGVATNKKTLKDIKRKKFRLLIHKDGDIRETRAIQFDNSQKENVLSISREQLFPGVNTVTLFDEENRPIAERLIYNHLGVNAMEAEVSLAKKMKDSLGIQVGILSERVTSGKLSISVLPSETRAYNQKINIFSEFLLKPYINGYVENPAYYFRGLDSKKNYDLDLLLLTQGWSRFEWKNIFNRAPVANFPYENGLTLKGSFNGADVKQFPSFYMEDSKYHDSRAVLLENPDFEIPNLLVDKDEEVQIKLIRENGKPSSRGFYAKILPGAQPWVLRTDELIAPEIHASGLPELDYKWENKTIYLDEVKVIEQKLKFSSIIGQSDIEIDQKLVNQYPRVIDIIRMKGFNVIENPSRPGAVQVFSRRTRSIRGGPIPPVIYLDGTLLTARNGEGFQFLYELYTWDIERITFGLMPDVTQGPLGAGGAIRIWSRRTPLIDKEGVQKSKIFIDAANGFDAPKEFYSPKYYYASPMFEFTGALHWEPQLELDIYGKATFKMVDAGMQNISFYIEGMTEDGSLISTIKTINLSKNSNP